MGINNDSGQFMPLTMDAPQFALLDYLVPGFSVFTNAIQASLGINLNLYIPLLIIVFGSVVCVSYMSEYFWNAVERYLMSSVRIRTDDEIYNMMMMWIANQNFSQRSRRFIVNTNLNSRSWLLWSWRDNDEDDEGDGKKKPLRYTPSYGTHYFWYKGNLLLFERLQNREQSAFLSVSEREELTISCFGRNPKIIKDLLVDARETFMKKDQNKTLIYRGSSGTIDSAPTWQRCMSRETRPFSTVILNEKVKQELIDDVEDYLEPATRRWYANRGIPYRRGYLLHGPPGTGKSSLSLALAGFFQLRIYIVSLSSIVATEENLSTLFGELPRKCVVLLEDIDSAGLTHTRETDGSDTEPDTVPTVATTAASTSKSKKSTSSQSLPIQRLSLSGLLNILDGVASQEGRVLIMTTNHIEKLDKALIRPGRVDMVVKFGLADAGMSTAIFRAIYVPYEDEDTDEQSKPAQDTSPRDEELVKEKAKQRKESIERIDRLAKEFAAKIPEHEFSPAEIQGLLLRHKHKPEMAIEQAEEWVVQTRKDKKQKEIDEAEKRRKEVEERKKAEEKEKKQERKEKRKARKQKKSDKKDSASSASSSEDEQEQEKSKSRGKKSKSKSKDKKMPDEAKNVDDADSSGSSSSSEEEKEELDSNKSKPKPSAAEPSTTATMAHAEKEDSNSEERRQANTAESKDDGEKKTPSDSGYDT